MNDQSKSRLYRTVDALVIAGVVLKTMITDIPHGIWHMIRCEGAGSDWVWEKYETEIGGEPYELYRCSHCHYDRRTPAGELGI